MEPVENRQHQQVVTPTVEYRQHVHLELMRDNAKTFPAPDEPTLVESVRVWHCGYRSLGPLGSMVNLAGADIASFPDDSFDVLGRAEKLRYLSVVHLPKVADLTALAKLKALETVRLHTLPSWDTSAKRTHVASLTPLLQLPKLKSLELFGVVPDDESLLPLAAHPALKSVRLHGYDDASLKAFKSAANVSDDFAPAPWF